MDFSVRLDEWLAKNEEARIGYFTKAKELRRIWQDACADARKQNCYASKTIDDYSAVKGRYKKDIKALALCIGGKEYLSSIYSQANDYNKFFTDNGLQPLNKGDGKLIQNYKLSEIIERVKKETAVQKADIIARTYKILEGEAESVQDFGWTLILSAANGKKAKLWAVEAGGYNIQCYHIRVLVKAVK